MNEPTRAETSSSPVESAALAPAAAAAGPPAIRAAVGTEFPPPPLRVTLREGLFGGLIALVCLFPPGIHLITGPLGPIIGGGFAGVRTAARAPEARWIAVTVSVVVVGGAALLAWIGSLLFSTASGPRPAEGLGSLEPETLIAISAGLFVYQSVFGWLGARVGGWLRRNDV